MTDKQSTHLEVDTQAVSDTLQSSVHFSFKTINSIIEGGGIRLTAAAALDLPYVSARTLMSDGLSVPVDYQSNISGAATHLKAVKAALGVTDDTLSDSDQTSLLSALSQISDTALASNTQSLNTRMRQILVPTDSGYLSLSPLSSAGVSYLINEEADAVKADYEAYLKSEKQKPDYRKLVHAHVGIGGSNPQNVGAWVREMQRPLYVKAPARDKELVAAWHIYYQGFDWYLPTELLLEFKELESQAMKKGYIKGLIDDELAQDSELRELEKALLIRLIESVLGQGDQKRELMLSQFYNLPNEQTDKYCPFTHQNVSTVVKGLLEPKCRTEDWRDKFATELARKLIASFDPDNKDIRLLRMDSRAESELIRHIKEALYS